MTTRVALICGHRYGDRLARALIEAQPRIDFVRAYVLHPRNVHRYGGYESPNQTLRNAGISITFFDDIGKIPNNAELVRDRPNYVLVCGLRQIIPVEILWELARINRKPSVFNPAAGFICFHPSDLPDGAGMAPVQWAILERASNCTVTSFFIDDKKIDGGPVISKASIAIATDGDAGDLDKAIGNAIYEMMRGILDQLVANEVRFTSQSSLGVERRVRPQIRSADRWVDENDSMDEALVKIRAFAKPYGGTAALVLDRPVLIYRVVTAHDRNPGPTTTQAPLELKCCDGVIYATEYEWL